MIASGSEPPRNRFEEASRIDKFAWRQGNQDDKPSLSPCIKHYNSRLSTCLTSKRPRLFSSRMSFPISLWSDILANQFIDFDKVYAAQYVLESETKQSRSLDELDIMLHTSTGSHSHRAVHTHGEHNHRYPHLSPV